MFEILGKVWRSGLGFDDGASLPYAIGFSIFLAFFFVSFFECYTAIIYCTDHVREPHVVHEVALEPAGHCSPGSISLCCRLE